MQQDENKVIQINNATTVCPMKAIPLTAGISTVIWNIALICCRKSYTWKYQELFKEPFLCKLPVAQWTSNSTHARFSWYFATEFLILTAKNTNESWRPDPSAIMETTILAAPAGWMDVMSVPFKQGAGLRDQALVHILPNIYLNTKKKNNNFQH